MAYEEEIETIARSLVLTNGRITGSILHGRGRYKNAHTAQVKAQKVLNELADLNRLEKCGERGNYFYRLRGCRSEWGDHARAVTEALALCLTHFPDSQVHREHFVREVALRPDALVLLKKEQKALAIWLEACIQEPPEYARKKENALKAWDALPYLSGLFGYRIPAFHLVRDSELATFLKEAMKCRT